MHSSPKGLVLFVVNTGERQAIASASLNTESLGIDPNENYVLHDVCGGREKAVKGSSLSTITLEVRSKDCTIRRISKPEGSWIDRSTAQSRDEIASMRVEV